MVERLHRGRRRTALACACIALLGSSGAAVAGDGAAEPEPPPPPPPAALARALLFLVATMPRSGSSWFVTRLAQLPCVASRGEDGFQVSRGAHAVLKSIRTCRHHRLRGMRRSEEVSCSQTTRDTRAATHKTSSTRERHTS